MDQPAQHTPGPWQVKAGRDIYGPAGEYIADVRFGDRPHNCPHAVSAANGRLIVAAPEMLAFCEEALERLTPYRARNAHVDEFAERLGELIAKIKGQT